MLKLLKKLHELQTTVVGLTKDKAGNSYQYVSGDKILSIVRPQMDKLGLILIPEVLEATFTRQDYNLYDKNGNPKPKSEMFCELKMRFTWVDVESGENYPCIWASSGQNNWDKSYGSAVTYGERYFLLKFFHIATDKDDVDAVKTPEEELNDLNWVAYINSLNTIEDLDKMWAQYGAGLKGNKEVITAYNKRKQALLNAAQS